MRVPILLRLCLEGFAVEVVGADVGRNAGREHRVGYCGISLSQGLAEGGSRYVLVQIGEEVQLSLVVEAKDRGRGLRGDADSGRKLRREGLLRQGGEWIAGTGGDDEIAEQKKVGGAAPVVESLEGVCAEKAVELVVGAEGGFEGSQGVVCVVMGAVGSRLIQLGGGEARVRGSGKGDHGEAVCVAGEGRARFQRLASNGCEEDLIEGETVGSGASNGDMAKVRRVETATEEGDAHRAWYMGGGRGK